MVKRLAIGFGVLFVILFIFGLARGDSADYVLPSGATHSGNLTVAARRASLEEGSVVRGDVSIIAVDEVRLAGRIEGKLSILVPSGSVTFGPQFAVSGDAAICAARLPPLDGINIAGQRSTGCDQLGTMIGGAQAGPLQIPFISRFSGDFPARVGQVVINAFVIGGIGALLALFFPVQIRRITETAYKSARVSGTVGFLTMGMIILLTVLFAGVNILTAGLLCIGLPVVGIAWLLIAAALVVGWVAVSFPIGALMMRRRGSPIVAAAVGALALTLAQGLLEILPILGIVGGLALVIIGSVGFGAVILTRLGTRPYPEIVHH